MRAGYAGVVDSHLCDFASRLFVRRQGRLSSRQFAGKIIFVFGGFQDFGLVYFPVVFLVRPCSECRWAALAFPRISGSLWSVGEAG